MVVMVFNGNLITSLLRSIYTYSCVFDVWTDETSKFVATDSPLISPIFFSISIYIVVVDVGSLRVILSAVARLIWWSLLGRRLAECWAVINSQLPGNSCGTGRNDIGSAVSGRVGGRLRCEGESRTTSSTSSTITARVAVSPLDVGNRR